MNFRKIAFSLAVYFVAVLAVCKLWQQVCPLSLILLVLVLLKHKVFPAKRELLFFTLTGLLGSTGEVIGISGGAWSYTKPQLFNIPLWLPLLWGLAGMVGVTFYEGLTTNSGTTRRQN